MSDTEKIPTIPTKCGQLSQLEQRVQKHIRSFDASALWYRRTYLVTSLANVIMSGLISIIAGWKPAIEIGGNIILILGSFVMLNSSIGFFIDPKRCWLIYASKA